MTRLPDAPAVARARRNRRGARFTAIVAGVASLTAAGLLPAAAASAATESNSAVVSAVVSAPSRVSAPEAAHRAPGDFLSVAVTGGNPNFGYLKQGTSVTRTISIQNDGRDGWSMDPAPLTTLAAPFAFVSTTLMAGQEVEPGQTRSITVSYTAPAAGTVSNMPITLTAVDVDAPPGTLPFAIDFRGESLDTDRSYFDFTTAAGGSTIDFGQIKPGATAKLSMKLVVRGIDPMKFADSQISVLDGAGKPLPLITVSRSDFAGPGATFRPGMTATFDLTFAPTADGTFTGTVTVSGKQMSGDPEAKDFVASLPFTAKAVTPATPTPTPTPTPTRTATPTPTPTATGGGTSGGTNGSTGGTSGSGAAAGTSRLNADPTLAHTGASPVVVIGVAALFVTMGAVATEIATVLRRRRRIHQ